MTTDHLTALQTTNGSPATKRHVFEGGEWSTQAYSAGSHFAWSQCEVASIEDLHERLTTLADQAEWFVVRGEPTKQTKYLRRTYHDRGQHEPHFKPVDRRWLCIDIDRMPAPPRASSPDDLLEHALAQLPSYFDGVATHWQWSASAGIKKIDTINLHLWYWLDRPACDFSLREWAKELREDGFPIDSMLYNPVQPHFTADPIIEGAEDPVSQRSGLRGGEPTLTLPDTVVGLEAFKAQERRRKEEERRRRKKLAKESRQDPRQPELRHRYVQSALNSACDKIAGAPEGDRHRTIFSQAAAVGELLHTGLISEADARGHLEEAALAAIAADGRQKEAIRTVVDGLDHGRQNPRDLSHVGLEDELAGGEDEQDDGWLADHQPITCDKFERTATGCAHYTDGACALDDEFMCVEWLKANPPHTDPDDYRPPRAHWSDDV